MIDVVGVVVVDLVVGVVVVDLVVGVVVVGVVVSVLVIPVVVDPLITVSSLAGLQLRGERHPFVLRMSQVTDSTAETSSIGRTPLGGLFPGRRLMRRVLGPAVIGAFLFAIIHYLLIRRLR